MTTTIEKPVSAVIDTLPIERLNAYLRRHILNFDGLQRAEKFSGGQSNPTFLLYADSGEYVLRRKPPGKLLQSAHAVDREFRVIRALAKTDVPVAKAYHLCEDESVIGSTFYVMSFEVGRVFWDPKLPEMTDAADRRTVHEEMVRVLAALHNVDVAKVGLADYGRSENFFERQTSRWTKQYRAAETQRIDAMEALRSWLPENIPHGQDQVSLIHGDYRLDNVMFALKQPKPIAVLDWELSTLGHPLSDLGYYCMGLRVPSLGEFNGLHGVDRAALNIPSEDEIVQMYCALRGLEAIEDWHYYLAFSFFRLAAIVQGVYHRSLQGNASNPKAASLGGMVEPLAQQGLDVLAEYGAV